MNVEPTVFIVDDDAAFAESLSALVSSLGLKTDVYSSAEDFMSHFNPDAPGCLILDVRMPIVGGLALQQRLTELPLCPAIIVMTGHAEVPAAVRAMRQGAVEYLPKTCAKAELVEAIRRAIAQDKEDRAKYIYLESIRARFNLLTPAENQVLQLVLKGTANKTMASTLDISRRTVEVSRAKIMQKLGVETVAELVRLAIEVGMKIE